MDTQEFFEEFADLPIEVKRQVLQEQIDSYFGQAFAWKVKAAVLRKQKGYAAKKALREREIDAALGNARLNLESMQIIIELIEELLPLKHSAEVESSQVTIDTLTDMLSIEEMEEAAEAEVLQRQQDVVAQLETIAQDGKA